MLIGLRTFLRRLVVACALALPVVVAAQTTEKPFSNEQLDQMLAQVALYPDSLLSQVLMAATYPDEFQAAAAWSKAHPDSKGDDAVKMVEDKNWDPSVASLAAFPEVLITLGEKPDYVKTLGDAFLAQPDDVMSSVQRLRTAAQQAGNLKSNEQIRVSTEALPPQTTVVQPPPQTTVIRVPAPTQTIVIEPAQPSVVYVPAYNPTAVYGSWWYPSSPPYYYPPPAGYWFSRTIATGIAWGVGIGISNALWGGFDWHHHNVNINVNRYNNINVYRRLDVNSNRTTWYHDTGHRGNVSYRGGNVQRQNLERNNAVATREQYRGKDASRDASRERAQASMQQQGVAAGSGSARDRAQIATRDQARAASADQSAARQRAQTADRDAARQRAQSAERDNAFKGAGDRQAKQQIDRGAASQKLAQQSQGQAPRPSAATGGGASPRAASASQRGASVGAGARSGGDGSARATSGGANARAGGGGKGGRAGQ